MTVRLFIVVLVILFVEHVEFEAIRDQLYQRFHRPVDVIPRHIPPHGAYRVMTKLSRCQSVSL